MSDEHDYANAVEILEEALARLIRERDNQREYLAELIEQGRIAELMLSEANVAVRAVEGLLAGGLYDPGGPILSIWDAREERLEAALRPPQAPQPVAFFDFTEIPWALVERFPEPEAGPGPVETAAPPRMDNLAPSRAAGRAQDAVKAAADDERTLSALKRMAAGRPEAQVSLSALAPEADVPVGSLLFVLRRIADAGLIEIIPAPPGPGAKKPNTYRLLNGQRPEATRPQPGGQEQRVFKLAEKVTKGSSLRDRIAAALSICAGTTSGLATLLDVKELLVCQTLTAMEHEAIVRADPMPEAGRRAQTWRMAQ